MAEDLADRLGPLLLRLENVEQRLRALEDRRRSRRRSRSSRRSSSRSSWSSGATQPAPREPPEQLEDSQPPAANPTTQEATKAALCPAPARPIGFLPADAPWSSDATQPAPLEQQEPPKQLEDSQPPAANPTTQKATAEAALCPAPAIPIGFLPADAPRQPGEATSESEESQEEEEDPTTSDEESSSEDEESSSEEKEEEVEPPAAEPAERFCQEVEALLDGQVAVAPAAEPAAAEPAAEPAVEGQPPAKRGKTLTASQVQEFTDEIHRVEREPEVEGAPTGPARGRDQYRLPRADQFAPAVQNLFKTLSFNKRRLLYNQIRLALRR